MTGALIVDHLCKKFGHVHAVAHATLTMRVGTICALVGDNGAGKTTLFNLISGAISPDSGRILWDGRRIDRLTEWRSARLGIGRLHQEVRVFPNLSAMDNIMAGFPNQPGEQLWKLAFQPQVAWRIEKRNRERAAELLDLVGLSLVKNRWANALSYGEQKLLAVARLLASDPRLVLLDEPTAGLSPSMGQQVLALIGRMREEGRAILLIEHDMESVYSVADQIVTMDHGETISSEKNSRSVNFQAASCDPAIRVV